MSDIKRVQGRQVGELREIIITRGYTRYAEGSVLVQFGDNRLNLLHAQVHIRLDAAGKQLEMSGPSGNYMPIEVSTFSSHFSLSIFAGWAPHEYLQILWL